MARQKLSSTGVAPGQLAPKTLVLDNGANTIKAGFSSTDANPSPNECYEIPNCVARSDRDKRTYIGAEFSQECDDYGDLKYRRPVEKGYIVNWESEKAIWERTFFNDGSGHVKRGAAAKTTDALHCDPKETNLILTEAPNAPAALQRNADEMVFEEFGFASYYRTIAPVLNAYAPSPFPSTAASPTGVPLECLLVVDAGHSHTTITPLYHGRAFQSAIRRLDIGGKTLNNHMKALISRTFDVQKEDHIVQEMKEDVCYISSNFNSDLERTWKGGRYDPRHIDTSIAVDYVLPDYETIKRGFPRPHDPRLNMRNAALGIGTEGGRREHVATIGNERFVVPELLFTPSDIGMQQDGLPGTILQSIDALPAGLKQAYLANIVIVGGASKIRGFVERLEAELRSMVEDDLDVRVARAEDPVKNAWLGGARLAANAEVFGGLVVTKGEYEENGEAWTRRRLAGKVER